MPEAAQSGWGRSGHRRAVLVGGFVAVIILGGGVTAWAEVGGGSAGYRMATVTRADIGTTLSVVGTVEPVNDAAAAFQVGGKVATVDVAPGQQVTAGETLGSLDATALNEAVSSAQSTLSADQAKLAEDEANQSGASSTSSSTRTSTSKSQTPSSSSTTTTTPATATRGGGVGTTVAEDQTTLTQDESTLSRDQQKEVADLTQAQTSCTSTSTATQAGQATCEAALQTVQVDEQTVSRDQDAVSKDETALGQALAEESSGASAGTTAGTGPAPGGTGTAGFSPTQAGHALTSASNGTTGNTGTMSSGTGGGTTSSPGNGSSGSGSGTTDTPEQIASDQAAIDAAQANLTMAQQSLAGTTLTSPIDGTVVSVGFSVGNTVSAGSSTAIITIIGTASYEVQATLESSQVPVVKVGQSAAVAVDGVEGSIEGKVSQVGPVQSGQSGYSYPLVVALPGSTSGLFTGSTANVQISTGEVSHVVAVPTSAVQSLGARDYVLVLIQAGLTRKAVKTGMVGDTYTQVLSGLSPGQSVVLADYAEPVPSSNSNTTLGAGGLLNGGGLFGGAGGFTPGAFRAQRLAGGGGPGASGG